MILEVADSYYICSGNLQVEKIPVLDLVNFVFRETVTSQENRYRQDESAGVLQMYITILHNPCVCSAVEYIEISAKSNIRMWQTHERSRELSEMTVSGFFEYRMYYFITCPKRTLLFTPFTVT